MILAGIITVFLGIVLGLFIYSEREFHRSMNDEQDEIQRMIDGAQG